MDAQPTHLMSDGNAESVGVLIPRWIEVKDQRYDASQASALRSRFYVVSPQSSLAHARAFAHAYAQRERMERMHRLFDGIQGPFAILATVAVVWIIVAQISYLWLVVPFVFVVGFQFLLQDAAGEVYKPFDVQRFQEPGGPTMLYRVHISEYTQAVRFSTTYPDRAAEAHRLMWRLYAMKDLHRTSQRDFAVLQKSAEITPAQIEATQGQLAALHALILDAEGTLRGLINPARLALPLGRDRLVELMHQVNAALAQGIAELTPRIEQEQERLAQYRELMDQMQEHEPDESSNGEASTD